MAHFAELDENNVVLRVIVVSNDVVGDGFARTTEEVGAEFARTVTGSTNLWVQTSYNDNFRKQYAGVGFTYDGTNDVFICPQPFPSWKLDKTIWDWVSPVPVPEPVDGSAWIWDEPTLSWVLVEGYGTVTIPPA
jgi:hypothetical protein